MPIRHTEQVQVRLPIELKRKLRKHARAELTTEAAVARRAIALFLARVDTNVSEGAIQ
jgi:predicted transcriptional regulator